MAPDAPTPDAPAPEPAAPTPGRDTPTGTDPGARYDHPGYEDKSLGQAVNQDSDLVDELLAETGGDVGEAERRFAEESAGAPALARQESDRGAGADRRSAEERVAAADRRNGEPDA